MTDRPRSRHVDHEQRARPPADLRASSSRPSSTPATSARLLRHDLRGARLRRALRDRRPRRVPDPVPALAVRHGVPAALQGLSLRAPEDLRDGHQQRPLLRLPAAVQPVGRPEARHGPRLRPQRLLQEQHLLQPHQPQDDGRDGQPRQPDPVVHGAVRRGRGRELHRQLPVAREPDRHPLDRHQAPRGAQRPAPVRRATRRPDAASSKFQSKGYMDSFVNPPAFLKEQASRRRPRSRRPSSSPSSPSATSCCSCWSTPR